MLATSTKPHGFAEEEFLGLAEIPLSSAREVLASRRKSIIERRGPWLPLEEACAEIIDENHGRCFGLFAPIEALDEGLDLSLFPKQRMAFPRIEGDTMTFHRCQLQDLEPSKRFQHILEAPASAPSTHPEILFVPCNFADTRGRRVGRGGGHYDRYMATKPFQKAIGLLNSDYLWHELPPGWIQEHDMPLQALITERHYFHIKEKQK